MDVRESSTSSNYYFDSTWMLDCFGDFSDSDMLYMSSDVLHTAFSLQVLCLSHFSHHYLRSQIGFKGTTYQQFDHFQVIV